MKLIQLLVPLFDRSGRRISRSVYEGIAKELAKDFGGVTAYVHSPALGLWRRKGKLQRDEVVVFEIMVGRIRREYWRKFRNQLEAQFLQQEIVVRALPFEKL